MLIDERSVSTRFVIVCAARTGSTMLRLMLDSHPDICCHGEALGAANHMRGFNGIRDDRKSNLRDYMIDLRARDPVRFLHEFVFQPGGFSAVGLKVKYEELQQPRLQPVLDWLCSANDVKILHLTRASRFRRYVSHLQAGETGINLVSSEAHRPKPVRMTLAFDQCVRSMSETQAAEELFRNAFAGHEVFELVYEDLVACCPAQVDGVQQFLGVVPRPLSTHTIKLGVSDLSEVIDNFNDLKLRARGTEFESQFA